MIYYLFLYKLQYISVPVIQFQYIICINTVLLSYKHGVTTSHHGMWLYDMITILLIQFYYCVFILSQYHIIIGSSMT